VEVCRSEVVRSVVFRMRGSSVLGADKSLPHPPHVVPAGHALTWPLPGPGAVGSRALELGVAAGTDSVVAADLLARCVTANRLLSHDAQGDASLDIP